MRKKKGNLYSISTFYEGEPCSQRAATRLQVFMPSKWAAPFADGDIKNQLLPT